MKTLFLAWQDKRVRGDREDGLRAWFPIGRLDADPNDAHYRFAYTRGVLQAKAKAGFQPLEAFPKLEALYESAELFPLFQNRLISTKREDYAEYLHRLDLSPGADPFEILAISGGGKQTDNLEVFPKIQTRRDGSFACKFFLHGWRHVNQPSQERIQTMRPGDPLQVSVELNNPATGAAIQVESANDYFMLGWAPRYLIKDVLQAISGGPAKIQARVIRVNPPPAPHNQRVLVEIEGMFQVGYQPMSSEEFLPLVA